VATLTTNAIGQELLKIGPSFLQQTHYDKEKPVTAFGFEASLESEVMMKHSLYAGINAHFGSFTDTSNKIPEKVKSKSIGFQAEYRVYFIDRYEGPYFGFGSDFRFMRFTEQQGTFSSESGGLDLHFGISVGYHFKLESNHRINPSIYFGYDPIGFSDYSERTMRISLTYGF